MLDIQWEVKGNQSWLQVFVVKEQEKEMPFSQMETMWGAHFCGKIMSSIIDLYLWDAFRYPSEDACIQLDIEVY